MGVTETLQSFLQHKCVWFLSNLALFLTSSLAHFHHHFLAAGVPPNAISLDPSVGKVCSASFPCFIQVFMRYVWRFDLNCDSKSEILGYDRISSKCLWTKCWEKHPSLNALNHRSDWDSTKLLTVSNTVASHTVRWSCSSDYQWCNPQKRKDFMLLFYHGLWDSCWISRTQRSRAEVLRREKSSEVRTTARRRDLLTIAVCMIVCQSASLPVLYKIVHHILDFSSCISQHEIDWDRFMRP